MTTTKHNSDGSHSIIKPPMTYGSWLYEAEGCLQKAKIPDPRRSAELLLSQATHTRISLLRIHENHIISAGALIQLELWLQRRLNHEPVQYILGETEFYGLTYKLNSHVLIPRPETEGLVDSVLACLKHRGEKEPKKEQTLLEIGVGSGCVFITLLKEYPMLKALGVDCSKEALAVASANAGTHGVSNRCELRLGNDFKAVTANAVFDFIVSNPPYIPQNDINHLELQVSRFEPHLALDGGQDGLDVIRVLLQKAPLFLKPGGFLLFEFGENQVEMVSQLAKENSTWRAFEIISDLNHRPRICKAQTWMQ